MATSSLNKNTKYGKEQSHAEGLTLDNSSNNNLLFTSDICKLNNSIFIIFNYKHDFIN